MGRPETASLGNQILGRVRSCATAGGDSAWNEGCLTAARGGCDGVCFVPRMLLCYCCCYLVVLCCAELVSFELGRDRETRFRGGFDGKRVGVLSSRYWRWGRGRCLLVVARSAGVSCLSISLRYLRDVLRGSDESEGEGSAARDGDMEERSSRLVVVGFYWTGQSNAPNAGRPNNQSNRSEASPMSTAGPSCDRGLNGRRGVWGVQNMRAGARVGVKCPSLQCHWAKPPAFDALGLLPQLRHSSLFGMVAGAKAPEG